MTTTLYEIETSESDDGTLRPDEALWTPAGKDAVDHGFVVHRGLYVAGISSPADDRLHPQSFVALGHHKWSDLIEAAATYMDRVHGWRTLHSYPDDDPSETIHRIPRAVLTWCVLLLHPHPDHPCGCEWEGSWRMIWAPPDEPGAIPITAMRHPAAPAAAAGLPDPDQGGLATWAG
ncbi:hypothetical protein [Streptomyces fuscichromogenes]|uniref:Uncharacterized protein n=1 Tax=Streptomyces fuscichromogenes TaxID=1324013 RepID=A0A917XQE3_9ACTN|nr:hypothetical protein [Streptomyces fuscichromogenes]GGN45374.1 hypothetical protein GCM10011578_097220 [Streptomyces fuscichromogenes]